MAILVMFFGFHQKRCRARCLTPFRMHGSIFLAVWAHIDLFRLSFMCFGGLGVPWEPFWTQNDPFFVPTRLH